MARPISEDGVLGGFHDDPVSEDMGSQIDHNWIHTEEGIPACSKCQLSIDDKFIKDTGGEHGPCPGVNMKKILDQLKSYFTFDKSDDDIGF